MYIGRSGKVVFPCYTSIVELLYSCVFSQITVSTPHILQVTYQMYVRLVDCGGVSLFFIDLAGFYKLTISEKYCHSHLLVQSCTICALRLSTQVALFHSTYQCRVFIFFTYPNKLGIFLLIKKYHYICGKWRKRMSLLCAQYFCA